MTTSIVGLKTVIRENLTKMVNPRHKAQNAEEEEEEDIDLLAHEVTHLLL